MSDDREGKIRERAYRLWQDEGEPHGKHDEHWHRAQQEFPGEQPAATSEPQDGSDTPAVTSGHETSGAELTEPLANEPADSPATTVPSGSPETASTAGKSPRGRGSKSADSKAPATTPAPKRPGPRTKRA